MDKMKIPVHNYSVTFMLDYITIQTNATGISEDAAIFAATGIAADNLGMKEISFDRLCKDAWAEITEENIDEIEVYLDEQ
jgi:hypothetical protein